MDQQNNGQLSMSNFSLLTVIGKGSYAKVLLVKKKDNDKLYAMKALKKKYIEQKRQEVPLICEYVKEHIMTERNVLVKADHPFIVKLYYSFQNEKKLFFLLEYCPGGELFNLLQKKKQLNEDQARFYSAQMVIAIEYLHQNNIIYREYWKFVMVSLKPENVLIDTEGYIRLTDFGLSKRNVVDDRNAFSVVGTPEYLAPEILLKQGHGKAVDWWTLGCILYEMTTGMPPFYCSNRKELFEKIKNWTPKYPSYLSADLKNLLDQLFRKQPEGITPLLSTQNAWATVPTVLRTSRHIPGLPG
jgi:serum/glucocorticoid-regulated kinase 2